MPQPTPTPATVNEYDAEEHPSFGWAEVNRTRSTPPEQLFASDIRHSEYVMLRISHATRRRELHRDFIHASDAIVEVAMSMAQWADLVSAFGSSGVPVTIARLAGEGLIPGETRESHLELSARETADVGNRVLDEVRTAVEAVRAAFDAKAGRGDLGRAVRDLEIQLGNAEPNMRFAAKSFTEHVETAVTKAHADIAAMVERHAERLGIEAPADVTRALMAGPDGGA